MERKIELTSHKMRLLTVWQRRERSLTNPYDHEEIGATVTDHAENNVNTARVQPGQALLLGDFVPLNAVTF